MGALIARLVSLLKGVDRLVKGAYETVRRLPGLDKVIAALLSAIRAIKDAIDILDLLSNDESPTEEPVTRHLKCDCKHNKPGGR